MRKERGRNKVIRGNVQGRSLVALIERGVTWRDYNYARLAYLECNSVDKRAASKFGDLENKLKATLVVSVAERVMAGTVIIPLVRENAQRRGSRRRIIDGNESKGQSSHCCMK
jgi:hypothetical protein